MKFKQLLNILDDFDGELIVKDLYESRFSFGWGDMKLTKLGKEKFKQIIQSDVKITKGVIILQDENIKEDDYQLFISAVAGYVASSDYDKWFVEKK